ncbi:hypothetical protein [Streptomyces somaliensis]|uniref:hypothetical protein n=1 Tax=Streptomyces somaliensis TaxID=78355 RepID=UPI0034E9346C|nr:hypothetical protein [Streptomyces somaliensis]
MTILPTRWPTMPWGTAFARSRVPSSRSAASSCAVVIIPVNASVIPSKLGSMNAPAEMPAPFNGSSPARNSGTTSRTVQST